MGKGFGWAPLTSWWASFPGWARTVLLLIFSDIIAGVVGNRADAILLEIAPKFVALVRSQYLAVFLVFVVALIISNGAWFRAWYQSDRALRTLNYVANLDDLLLGRLVTMGDKIDSENEIKDLLWQFQGQCVKIFEPHVLRMAIFRANGDYLTPWVPYEMSLDHERKFDIRPNLEPHKRRGIAGKVYLTQKSKVVHLAQVNGLWQADDPDYIDFVPQRSTPPYQTFVKDERSTDYRRAALALARKVSFREAVHQLLTKD